MAMVLIADLLARGVRFEAAEAVAVAQQLIAELTGEIDLTSEPDAPLLGPPTPANVFLAGDGSAVCLGCQATPAVFEVAVFLQTLLPAGMGQVPGGLRYTIARGLLDVDAPPFDSIGDFSRALARYERGDRSALVRAVIARATGEARVHVFGRPRNVSTPAVERRRTAPAAATLRRDLHDADRRLFEQRALAARDTRPVTTVPPPPAIVPASRFGRWRLQAVAAVLIGGIAVSGVADLVRHRRSSAGGPPTAAANGSSSRGSAVGGITRGPRVEPSPPKSAERDRRLNVPDTPRRDRPARERDSIVGGGIRDTSTVSLEAPADQDGALVRALDDQHRPVFSPAFASSGTAMFFHTGGTRAARSALAVASSPEEGGDLGVMTIVDDGARNYHVQPSPDGRLIAFDSDRDGERGVYLARRDGTNVRRVSGAGYAAVPTWAPDGRRIAYVRAEPDNPKVWNLWLQGIDEGQAQARRLTSYRYGQPWSASWFPDNRRVSYTHEDELVVLDVETGLERKFSSPIKGRLVRTPAVSPDGTKIIFQVFRHGAWILDLADRSMQCVLTDPTAEEFAWSPDGRRVAFHSRRDGQWSIYILHRS